MITPPLKPGDLIENERGIQRLITECRPTGYTWCYPDMPDKGNWWSENSTDPLFEVSWRRVQP